jgi:uncharacterized protein (TIGR02099 family)
MWKSLRILIRSLAVAAGVGVILAALAIGAFRVVAARLPGYKADLQAWVSTEFGFVVEYEGIDLRMTLSGPELSFVAVALAADGSSDPFVRAQSVDVTFDPFALVLDRAVRPVRLALAGIQITVQRTEDGTVRVAGARGEEYSDSGFGYTIPRDIQLVIQNSAVTYVDDVLGIAWPFANVSVTVDQDDLAVSVSVSAEPPAELASHIEASATGTVANRRELSNDWRAFIALQDADLGAAAQLVPALAAQAGTGDVAVWLQTADGELTSVLADLRVQDLRMPAAEGSAAYDRIALTSEWSRTPGGWSLALNDVSVMRGQREWPRDGDTIVDWANGIGITRIESPFLQLDDLAPFMRALPESAFRAQWLALRPRGALRAFDLRRSADDDADYEITARFDDLAVDDVAGFTAIAGLSGEMRADARGGSLRLSSATTSLENPSLIDLGLTFDNVSGLVVWREGRDGLRIVTDDLAFEFLGAPISTNMELSIPHDGTSPEIELETSVGTVPIEVVKPYVVGAKMPEDVARWLDRSLGGGRLEHAEVSFFGPVESFPFDGGEGQFRVLADIRNGTLDYLEDWPIAQDFEGELEFFNAGFEARGHARVLGNVGDDVSVRIADMRSPVLEIDANTTGPLADLLAFLLSAPTIARHLGPEYERLEAAAGTANLRLDLSVPLPVTEQYDLEADLEVVDGQLAYGGFAPPARDINGVLRLRDGIVTGEDIHASFLDGVALARVEPPPREGYRGRIVVDGEVAVDAVLTAFNLPYRSQVAGQTRWTGSLLLPEGSGNDAAPVQPAVIDVDANLSGLALRFPQPFAKAPAEATNLHITFAFERAGNLHVSGNLGATRHLRAEYAAVEGGFAFERGRLSFGADTSGDLPVDGLEIVGDLPALDLDAWLKLAAESKAAAATSGGMRDRLARIDLTSADLRAYGQSLGRTAVDMSRVDDSYRIAIDSEPVAGTLDIPGSIGASASARGRIVARLQRLFLQVGDDASLGSSDPRTVPGVDIEIEDFRFGSRRLGKVVADVQPDPLGLRLASFTSETPSFRAEGSGAWLVDGSTSQSRIAFSLGSSDVAAALTSLGLDPVIAGSSAQMTASLHWPGAPSADWMSHIGGDIAIHVEDGSMLDIEPGAGRIVGLMSIVTLPRRLALDFRDVFNKGLVFDEIGADFTIIDGNAYTDNLKLSGPAAEIGVVGRTGLRDRDFHQQAVVTAEPGNMLPTVGGLIGGPGVGAALLIFTRIFKQTLKGIGRASYCITGSWDAPEVSRLEDEQLDGEQICAELPAEWTKNAEQTK